MHPYLAEFLNKLISIFHDLDVLLLFLPLPTFFLVSILTCNMIFFSFSLVHYPKRRTCHGHGWLENSIAAWLMEKSGRQNSKFFIYMKEKEKGKRLIKISRIAMRQPQVSHTSFICFFFFIFSCVSHKKQTWGNIKCWEVIFVGTSCVISSFDDDLLDGCMAAWVATELKWMVLDLGLLFVLTSTGLKW
jgi:hypothetical protein